MRTPAPRRPTHRALVLAAAAGVAAFPLTAAAVGKVWQGNTGNWDTANAWVIPGQPNDGDFVSITQNNANVTYVNSAFPQAVLASLTINAATLFQSQHTLSVNNETIGTSAFGAVQQSGGTHTVLTTSGLVVGENAGSNGSYSLSGTGALNVSRYEVIAQQGAGTFTQTGGTHKVQSGNVSANLVLGDGATGSATYNLQGGSLLTDNTILSNGGAAVFNHSAGSHVVGNFLELGDGSNPLTNVKYNLSGAGTVQAPRLFIGGVSAATFTQTGGSNTTTNLFRLGNNFGASGTYVLSGGTLDVNGEADIGSAGNGVFNASGGKATFTQPVIVALFTGGTGSFNQSNGASVTAPQFVLGNGNGTAGALNVTGGTLTINGPLSAAASGGTATADISGGTVATQSLLLAAVSGTATFTHSGGTVTAAVAFNLGPKAAYTLSGGTLAAGQTSLQSGAALKITGGKFRTASLDFQNGTGKLDLTNQSLVVDYTGTSQLNAVRDATKTGFANAAWTGKGIQSSTAAADLAQSTGVGYGEAAAVLGLLPAQTTTWQGHIVDATTVLVRYTKLGDATLDGAVDFNDLVKLAQNYNTPTGNLWNSGDFTYDGAVDFNDLVKLAQNYNTALPAQPVPGASASFETDLAAAFAAVPEPGAALAALGATIAALRPRRRRPTRSEPPFGVPPSGGLK